MVNWCTIDFDGSGGVDMQLPTDSRYNTGNYKSLFGSSCLLSGLVIVEARCATEA